jgi:hypothetical protein
LHFHIENTMVVTFQCDVWWIFAIQGKKYFSVIIEINLKFHSKTQELF